MAWANAMGKEQQDSATRQVTDPEPDKFGGPPTDVVVKFALGQGNNSSAENAENAAVGMIMSAFTGMKLKEIRRGKPVEALLSFEVPTGTKMYPIRVIAEAMGNEQIVDSYFYKDEFDVWAAIPKS